MNNREPRARPWAVGRWSWRYRSACWYWSARWRCCAGTGST